MKFKKAKEDYTIFSWTTYDNQVSYFPNIGIYLGYGGTVGWFGYTKVISDNDLTGGSSIENISLMYVCKRFVWHCYSCWTCNVHLKVVLFIQVHVGTN